MKNQNKEPRDFAEVFPIIIETLPNLYAYEILVHGSNITRIGRRLSDRLSRNLDAYFVWSNHVLVSNLLDEEAIKAEIQKIIETEAETFRQLQDTRLKEDWTITPRAQADFVAFGMAKELTSEIKDILAPLTKNLSGKARVRRDFKIKGWLVKGKPSLSISIDSSVIFNQDLSQYAQTVKHETLIGLWVADKNPHDSGTYLKGEINQLLGYLDNEISRNDLLRKANREVSKELITQASSGELAVEVGEGEYQYLANALNIVLFTRHYKHFGINTKEAQNLTWIQPNIRASLVSKVANVAKSHKLIGDAYTSKNTEKLFFPAAKFRYDEFLEYGQSVQAPYNGAGIINKLRKHGFYNHSAKLGTQAQPLRLGFLNTSNQSVNEFRDLLVKELRATHLVINETNVISSEGASRVKIERAINNLLRWGANFIVGILIDSDSHNQDDWSSYLDFKSITMNKVANQVIDAKTLKKQLRYVIPNLVLGISSKIGNIPYALATPIDYADFVVGIDVARMRKKGGGSLNAAAMAIIHQKEGHFVECRVLDAQISGETVPAQTLRSLFPVSHFDGKKVIIHRDGPFRGNEKEVLKQHIEEDLNGKAFFVEVIKSGSPRLYRHILKQGTTNPPIGTVMVINDQEAFLVASQSKTATPNPLQIRTTVPFTIGKALQSVLKLTLLHYGSLRRPRAPISIHFSDKIGYLALRGVKPTTGHSNEMYWL